MDTVVIAALVAVIVSIAQPIPLYAAPETLAPDVLLEQTNLTGIVDYIADDPDSPDGNWLTAPNNVGTTARVSFPTPSGNLTIGAGLQEFRILLRLTSVSSATGDDTYIVHLYEDGANVQDTIASGGAVPTGGVVVSATWDATSLNNADGSLVECYVTTMPEQTGSPPKNRDSIEIGAIEWNVVYTAIALPTVTTQAATSIEDTTATGNGTITATGGENADIRGFVWDTTSYGDPGNVSPASSSYTNDVAEGGSHIAEAFTGSLTGLATGTTIYARAYAHNSTGYSYGTEVSFLTKPAAPTDVAASDGTDTTKVVVTWTKSTGATGYTVYEGSNDISGLLGDVATYDDTAAAAPTITAGTASASDGTSVDHVVLSLDGESANVGASRTYKVVATNATGNSADSSTNDGYRGVGSLTYQWQRSDADSDADYNTDIGTTDPYNDTGGAIEPDGRYYQCLLDATGATQQTSTSDRGYIGASASILLTKTGTLNDDDGTAGVSAGDTISYSFTVENTGNVSLTNVTIRSPRQILTPGNSPIPPR
jgi:hypothetical protein